MVHILTLLTSILTALSVHGASISSVQGSLSHPSKTVTLIYPDSRVEVNQQSAIGLVNPPNGYGFLGNISFAITRPNGTLDSLGYELSDCTGSEVLDSETSSLLLYFFADAVGTYQATWTFNYTYYPQTATVNSSKCYDGPSSSPEIFVLNRTFEAANIGKGILAPTITTISQLPSQPTGFFQTNPNVHSGASTHLTGNMLLVLVTILSIVASALGVN